MSYFELAVVSSQTFQAPILIERASPSTRKKFFEFFTVPIRNANTRAAYYRAIQRARLTNTRLMAVGYSTGFGDQFRASQAAGVSSAIRLIGKLAKPGKIEPR